MFFLASLSTRVFRLLCLLSGEDNSLTIKLSEFECLTFLVSFTRTRVTGIILNTLTIFMCYSTSESSKTLDVCVITDFPSGVLFNFLLCWFSWTFWKQYEAEYFSSSTSEPISLMDKVQLLPWFYFHHVVKLLLEKK